MKNEMEKKAFSYELKAIHEEGNLYIEGYAAVFGNIDSYRDIIQKGAFLNTISGKNGKRIKLCYQHDFDKVIGKIVELREDEKGLFFKAKVSNTALGKDVSILISDEALDEVSIGYRTKSYIYDEANEIRTITDLDLYEISLVSRAANEEATVTGTERKDEQKDKDLKDYTDKELIELKQKIDKEYTKRVINKI